MKSRKLYLVLTSVVIIVAALIFGILQKNEGIELGSAGTLKENTPSEWQSLIALDINSNNISVYLDGVVQEKLSGKIFVDENRDFFVPVNEFRTIFQCACSEYGDDTVVIQKREIKKTFKPDEKYTPENGTAWTEAKLINGVVYINFKALEQFYEYNVDYISEDRKIIINDSNSENCYPSVYRYRDVDRLPDIRNQGNFSTCWAFASLTALSSSLMPRNIYEFSIDNMVNNNGYNGSQNDGGDYTRAIAYLTAWKGPVLESEDEYGDGVVNMDAKPVKHVQEVQLIGNKDLDGIKKAVFLYGGVESSLYTSMKFNDETSQFFKNKTNSYYYNGDKNPNHDIVIVGWDDSFPKENFKDTPEGNGAFICMNSWGASFGDNGLFFVSYYDTNIGAHNVVYTNIEDTDNYDNIYQSDLCGWVGQLGYDSETAYFANVYEADGNQDIEAVGFYATGPETLYEIYYIEDFSDACSFEKKQFVQNGSFENTGYYTVNFKTPIAIESGRKYAIVVKITTPDSIHPIAIEYKAGKTTKNVILDDGEGYISFTGKSWEHVEETKQCNICLKMYTNNR